jgi:hypothetical protein
MTAAEVLQEVVGVLQQLQADSGREPGALTEQTCPIGELSDFDSHAGLEFTCAMQVALKMDISLDENLCVDDKQRRARSIGEIVARVLEIKEAQ